jgi:hypothetical protein
VSQATPSVAWHGLPQGEGLAHLRIFSLLMPGVTTLTIARSEAARLGKAPLLDYKDGYGYLRSEDASRVKPPLFTQCRFSISIYR